MQITVYNKNIQIFFSLNTEHTSICLFYLFIIYYESLMAINTSNLYKLLELNSNMNYTIFIVVVTLIVKKNSACSIIPFCIQHQFFWLDLMNPLLELEFSSKILFRFFFPFRKKCQLIISDQMIPIYRIILPINGND